MLTILLFCVGVMYTPGPVNILSLNCGMQRKLSRHVPFCLGVGSGLALWFTAVGYAGSVVADLHAMPLIAALGSGFILYLAVKIGLSGVDPEAPGDESLFSFRDGFLMQSLNPKTFLVVLPVATVQFPAASIHGPSIVLWSIGLGALGFGAPLSYAAVGSRLSRFVRDPRWFTWFNRIMGAMLAVLAVDMAYTHIYLALR